VIRIGERSERVSRLQFAMVQLGFMWPSKIRCETDHRTVYYLSPENPCCESPLS
jgi:hypothetical protein